MGSDCMPGRSGRPGAWASWAGLALALLVGGRARPALGLAGGPMPGAVSATTVKLPDGPGSVEGLNDKATVEVFSGQVAYSVPIDLPQGPGGFGPSLSLAYSGDLGNGPLGIGWALGSASIRRSLHHGVPSYTDADELDLSGIGGGGRLIRDGRPGKEDVYWVEGQGTSVRVQRLGVRWEVQDPSGTRYILGPTAASRQQDGNRISAWMVDSIVSLTNQVIRFEYLHDAGSVYLRSITWGPDDAFRLDLIYAGGSRYDETISYRTGFAVRNSKRLERLEVKVRPPSATDYVRSRVYELTYDETLPVSRLSTVLARGRDHDGVASTETLPPLRFTYAGLQPMSVTKPENTGGWVLNERGTSFFDVDGDGMSDLLRLELGNHQYRKGLGSSFADPRSLTGAEDVELESAQFMDLDGDARPELVRIVDDTWRAYSISGETWKGRGEWKGTQGVPFSGQDTVIGDVNGDGRMDVLQGAADALLVRFNGAAGLGAVVRLPMISPSDLNVEPGARDVQFTDFNGDGLLDAVWLTDEWMKVFLGQGDGTFVAHRRSFYPWGRGAFDVSDLHLADLNRDGLIDLVRVTAAHVLWFPGQADGTFALLPRHVDRPDGVAFDAVVTITDANGNGSQDVVWSSARGMWVLDLAGATSAGMLEKIENGMGLVKTFVYRASAQLAVEAEKAGEPWDWKLPVSVPVPTETTEDPGAGGPFRTLHFGVRDGFWDGEERRFGGFLAGMKSIAGSSAAETVLETTRYLPGIGAERVLRGQIWTRENQNALGKLLNVAKNEWEAHPVAALPDQPRLRRAVVLMKRSWNYEGVTSPVQTQSQAFYDSEGRPVVEIDLGRLDRSDDQRRVERAYNSSDDTWVRDKVCFEKVFSASATGTHDPTSPLAHTRHTYGDENGDAPAESGGCGIGKGWLRKTEGWLRAAEVAHCGETTDRWVELSTKTYDAAGNVEVAKEGGVERTYGYDAQKLRLVSESVKPSPSSTLSWGMVWDEVLGLPSQATDPNNDVSKTIYDDLGRPKSQAVNGRAHTHFTYQWNGPSATSPGPRTTTYQFDGPIEDDRILNAPPQSTTLWRETVEVHNGEGELLYMAKRLRDTTWIISGWTERDHRGLPAVLAEPFYFEGLQLPTARPAGFGAFQTMEHDGLGRASRQVLPAVNSQTAEKAIHYQAFEQTVTSSDLAPVRSVLDGMGRIVRTERTVNGILEEVDATYDAEGHVLSTKLQSGKAVHSFTYDTLGRLATGNDPDIGLRQLCYADSGLLSRHTNAEGLVQGFAYDGAGRLTARGSGSTRGPGDYVYIYDDQDGQFGGRGRTKGRLASARDPNGQGSAAFWYDELGRQRVMTRTIGSASGWEQFKLTASGLVTEQTSGDGFAVLPSYDRAGRLKSLKDAAGGEIWRAGHGATFDEVGDIDAPGRIVLETYGNGLRQTYQRDSRGLLSGTFVVNPTSGSDLYRITVEQRTGFGAPLSVRDDLSTGLDHKAVYHYDLAGRIDGAVLGGTPGTTWQFRYRYDGLQNMISRFQQGPNNQSINIISGYYRYGEPKTPNGPARGPRQLTSILHRDCPGDLTTFDYDKAGRQVTENQKGLGYDAFDQLVTVVLPGLGTQTNTYGFDGQRTSTSIAGSRQTWFSPDHTLATNGAREHTVSVGERLVAMLSFDNLNGPVPQPPSASVTLGALIDLGEGALRRAPAVLGGGLAVAVVALLLLAVRRPVRPLWQTAPGAVLLGVFVWLSTGCGAINQQTRGAERATDRKYFHQGLNVGPTLITSPTKAVREERRFEPFGQPIEPATLAADSHNSLNKETDPSTKWSYHGARWLAPQTARWTAPDPPVKAPDEAFMAQPWALHPYQYAEQNPTLFWDSNGEAAAVFDAALGHHYVPKTIIKILVNDYGLSEEAAAVFRTTTTGWASDVIGHGNSEAHIIYNEAVLKEALLKIKDMKNADASVAKSFVAFLRNPENPNPVFRQFIGAHEKIVQMIRRGEDVAVINKVWGPVKAGLTKLGGFKKYGPALAKTLRPLGKWGGRLLTILPIAAAYYEKRQWEKAGFVRQVWYVEDSWVAKEHYEQLKDKPVQRVSETE
jgi:RHS repeat-associated protein